MIQQQQLNFAFVEEIFEAKEEYIHFLLLMQAEFQEAMDSISRAICSKDLYALRKTLHNVEPHLKMLAATNLEATLAHIKSSLSTESLSEEVKKSLIQRVMYEFEELLTNLSENIKENQ